MKQEIVDYARANGAPNATVAEVDDLVVSNPVALGSLTRMTLQAREIKRLQGLSDQNIQQKGAAASKRTSGAPTGGKSRDLVNSSDPIDMTKLSDEEIESIIKRSRRN